MKWIDILWHDEQLSTTYQNVFENDFVDLFLMGAGITLEKKKSLEKVTTMVILPSGECEAKPRAGKSRQ